MIFFTIISSSLFAYSEAQEEGTLDSGIELVLNISPGAIEGGQKVHPIGFLHLIHEDGGPVFARSDLRINLESSNPEIVSVPQVVTLEKNDQYVKFDLTTMGLDGSVTIMATFGEIEVTDDLRVGITLIEETENTDLKINLPQAQMHSNSLMPISISLINAKGDVLQAPEDIFVILDFSKGLVDFRETELIIPKGKFYAETFVRTTENIGTAFIRANAPDIALTAVEKITITSTAPASLQLYLFPEKVAHTEDQFDLIVTVLDSEGNPTIATKDIPLQLFTDDLLLSESFDEDFLDFGPSAPILKKGQFSYHLKYDFQFQLNQVTEELDEAEEDDDGGGQAWKTGTGITIGVSSPDLGLTTDLLDIGAPSTQGTYNSTEQIIVLFTPLKMPRGASSILIYQLTGEILEDTDADEDAEAGAEDVVIRTQPFQTGTNYSPLASDIASTRSFSVISSDRDILKIGKGGPLLESISGGDSYGSSQIIGTEQVGIAKVAVTFEGIGSATTDIEVIDTLAPTTTRLFTPSGGDKILFDQDGFAEVYIMLVDASDRPTTFNKDIEFIITPQNEFVRLPAFTPYVKTPLLAESLPDLLNNRTNVEIIPVGIEVQSDLALINSFEVQPTTSQIELMPGVDSIAVAGAMKRVHVGIVQLVDPFGNPLLMPMLPKNLRKLKEIQKTRDNLKVK